MKLVATLLAWPPGSLYTTTLRVLRTGVTSSCFCRRFSVGVENW